MDYKLSKKQCGASNHLIHHTTVDIVSLTD